VGAGVVIMLLKDNKILLGKRNENPEKASSLLSGQGTWTMPGGKLDFGEDFEEAAKREVFEETGIKINKLKVICVNNDKTDSAHFVTIGLLSYDFEGQPHIKEPEEITEWRWFDLDDLPEPLYQPSKNVIENYKEGNFYKRPEKKLTLQNYQKECLRTVKEFENETRKILTWGLGVAGEAGDIAGCIKKTFIHKNDVTSGIRENIGDTMWYLANICNFFNWNLQEIIQENIDKLLERYPKGFTYHDAKRGWKDWNEEKDNQPDDLDGSDLKEDEEYDYKINDYEGIDDEDDDEEDDNYESDKDKETFEGGFTLHQ